MNKYNFIVNGKSYELGEEKFVELLNDEDFPVENIGLSQILDLIQIEKPGEFDLEYYDLPCEGCKSGLEPGAKFFKYLEYHFFIFTKEQKFVVSSISPEYKTTGYNKLIKQKKVDNSYIVSVMICENCGEYSVSIEQCEI
jgi:hypothetical protein